MGKGGVLTRESAARETGRVVELEFEGAGKRCLAMRVYTPLSNNNSNHWEVTVTTFLTLGWYCCSLLLSLYNKHLFGDAGLAFAFPLYASSAHMLGQFFLAGIVLWGKNSEASFGDFIHTLPLAAAAALDIGLSNASLRSISLSFYTMCKSSTLAFVLLFALILRLEPPSRPLLGSIAIISAGVVLMVLTEQRFVLVGFLLVAAASALAGLRWSLAQLLLLDSALDPLRILFLLAPAMFFTLISLAVAVEGTPATIINASPFWHSHPLATLLILPPIFLAFGMHLCEFSLVSRTGALTLSVLGICKEVATILASIFVFGDSLQVVNWVGLGITIIGTRHTFSLTTGISYYNHIRYISN